MASLANFYVKPEHVHIGEWINWNDDDWGGGRITMAKDTAELFNIFLGIFIIFVQAGLWVLVTFVCFQCNRQRRKGTASSHCRDGLFHQQQTILRNGVSPISMATAYFQMWSVWGWRNAEVIKRTWPLILAAAVSFAFFVVALPFITALAMLDNQGDEILIRSPNCGFWEAPFDSYKDIGSTDLVNGSWIGAAYVDSCYNSDAPSVLCDRFLPQRRLRTFEWSNTACPFDEDLCLARDSSAAAFTLQTDVLDSHKDFGINAPPDDRIKLQRTTTCAPLDVSRFSNITPGELRGEAIAGVYFGPRPPYKYTFGVSNYKQVAAESAYHLE
jgi:hypothetical protein